MKSLIRYFFLFGLFLSPILLCAEEEKAAEYLFVSRDSDSATTSTIRLEKSSHYATDDYLAEIVYTMIHTFELEGAQWVTAKLNFDYSLSGQYCRSVADYSFQAVKEIKRLTFSSCVPNLPKSVNESTSRILFIYLWQSRPHEYEVLFFEVNQQVNLLSPWEYLIRYCPQYANIEQICPPRKASVNFMGNDLDSSWRNNIDLMKEESLP